MFHYFGYGSNLHVISLRAKGVEPLSSEPAILEGWRVTFDIPDFFRIEGGTGNIRPDDGDAVHGVLHACRHADLTKLDQLEALGVTYRRVETSVTTYGGRRVRAYVYVGIAEILDPSCLPSERYRNILVRGATAMRLDRRYVERLRAMPALPRPDTGPFEPPDDRSTATGSEARELDPEALAAMPHCTALAGHVFDMSEARASHAYLRTLLGGRDATLLFLRRMDTSEGLERWSDVALERYDASQRKYLDAYLHEFAREYRWVARLRHPVVTDVTTADAEPPRAPRSDAAPKRRSWAPTHAIASRPPASLTIASRAVLDDADRTFEAQGHENEGFLSETFGFMPRELPRTELPRSHAAWDQLAAELPDRYRSLSLRRAVDALPVLSAEPEDLPDGDLLRAAALLGMLSHAYHYVETHPPERPPEALAAPWATVRRRLGRADAVLSYLDLIVYNWRLVDPERADPMRVDNLRLLVPTVDTDEERVFYLTQTEILAHASPIVAAVVRAQEAVVLDDRELLESSLLTITTSLQRIVREALSRIDPNRHGATHVDPVIWAKGVAPFAVPMTPGVQGPSGTSSPIFNTLDVFFGRKRYETFLGREIHALRATYPRLWRELIAALQEVSVVDYVANRGDAYLRGVLQETIAEYAGPNGFLGRHRMKVYGYLELAFKVGRNVTIGGFQGMFKDRTWEQVDGELESSREERAKGFPQTAYQVRVARVTPEDARAGVGVSTVVLDVAGTGIRYEAGDRCGILPESDPRLIARTLAALGATGEELVALTPEWREAVALRRGYDGATELSTEELLRFGRIRPVVPRVAEALHARTQSAVLARHLHAGTTARWELWDLLVLLAGEGFEPRTLLEGDALARVVPPEAFRMYSISSVMSSADTGRPTELDLTVGHLRYETETADGASIVAREGTASSFLCRAAGRSEPITMIIQHPARFALPRSARTPIVMIAGGTGLSPFRGFLVERGRQLAASDAWLIAGVRSREHFAYEDELLPHVRTGTLEVRVALSRDDAELVVDREGDEPRLAWKPAERRRVPSILLEPGTAARLDEMLRAPEEGGRGAHVYICGRTSFARSAMAALEEIFFRHARSEGAEREREVRDRVARLIADGRLSLEVFSGNADTSPSLAFDASELALRNDDAHGHWIAVDGRVYDMTKFLRRHPGGARILRGYAGMDASEAYARSHHGRTEIDAMREMYLLGSLRRLELGSATALAGGREISLSAVHRAWVQFLWLVVEMQNALRNDLSLQHGVTTRGDPVRPRSVYKLQRAVETHHRFLRSYVDVLTRESAPNLAAITLPFFAPDGDPFEVREALADARDGAAARYVEGVVPALFAAVTELSGRDPAVGDPAIARLERAVAIVEAADARLLVHVKDAALGVVRAFERAERHVALRERERVDAGCRMIVDEVRSYYADLAAGLGGRERWIASASVERAPEESPAMSMVLSIGHWTMEEDAIASVVVLRRTAAPFTSVEEIVDANDRVMRCFRAEHRAWGVVVDMRQAPRRNDPEFENAMRRLRDQIGKSFARVALVLESAAGVLQVNRIARDEGASTKTFATMSESAAVRFAKGTA